MQSITQSSSESKNRTSFNKKRRAIYIGLAVISAVIVLVPISYILRSTLMYINMDRQLIKLYQDTDFLELQIRFQWVTVSFNILIVVSLLVMTCIAIRTLRRYFANTFSQNIRQITLILYAFSICFVIRTAYETYENVRNANQLHAATPEFPDQFGVDLETVLLYLILVDGPISLILCLHHSNSRAAAARRSQG